MTSSISSQYPGSDILVLKFSNGNKIDVQVKTMSYQKEVNWYVPETSEDMDAVFVFNKISDDKKSIRSYIAKADYIAEGRKKAEGDYLRSHPNGSDKEQRMIS